jgi:Methyltransferase domain
MTAITLKNVPYVTDDQSVFIVQFGHKRKFLTIEDLLLAGYSTKDIVPIGFESVSTLPTGPCMPRKSTYKSISNALELEKNTDLLRQLWCAGFRGMGHEVGAGNRPTSVPVDCNVAYVDAFTFDEAADGSFIGKDNKEFVSVSIYETAETLKAIPDASSDFFILCHVVEHLPNPLRAIRTIYSKLKVGGTMFMVVPWGGHTFDRYRPSTSLHHLVADYLQPSRDRNLEHYLEFCDLAAHKVDWMIEGQESYERTRDTHLHVFSPESIRKMLDFSCTLDNWSSVRIDCPFHKETLQEFYVQLIK